MKPNKNLLNSPNNFWADIKLLSQYLGYTDRKTKLIKIPTAIEIITAYNELGLLKDSITYRNNKPKPYLNKLLTYFEFRATVLNDTVQHNLLNKSEAKTEFNKLKKSYAPHCPLPMNKQKGNKKDFAFFTCMINMLIEKNLNGRNCNFNPYELCVFTEKQRPKFVLSRRVDGAYPSTTNPKAIWEIKEYYNTTTFGSRVADGIYESLLDGYELKEVKTEFKIPVQHYLFIDDYRTWWEQGKPYLCRIIDMLHMGYITEVIVGKEIFSQLPQIVKSW